MESLITRLAEAGIFEAAVIDETFDPPSPAALGAELDEFWAEVEADSDCADELSVKQIPCGNRDEFEKDGIAILWEKRQEFTGKVAELIEALFRGQTAASSDAENVASHLEFLGIATVHRVGATGNVPANVPLVFLDYNLETGPRLPRQTPKSVTLAKQFARREKNSPFLILFSNEPRLSSIATRFRKTTGYLGGTFAFLAKEEARDRAKFLVQLSGFGVGHPVMKMTQSFFLALEKQLAKVSGDVLAEVMKLDVQDYAFIQRLALQDDGAPLGEYLLDIFGAVLSHELRSGDEVQRTRTALDGLHFDRHLPFSKQPSAPVRRIYQAVLTDPGVGVAKPHAVAGKTFKDEAGKEFPYPPLLTLGDIFVKDAGSPVYVIVSPACDLQYSPRNEDRKPNLDMSVHLLPGCLEKHSTGSIKPRYKRMEMFCLEGQQWRVLWLHERAISIRLGDFAEWQRKNGYERRARLTLPFAVSLQHHWTAQLGRVGLPVNMPLFNACDLEFHRPNGDGNWGKLRTIGKGDAIIVRHPRDSSEPIHFAVTLDGSKLIQAQLKLAAELLMKSQTPRATAANKLLADYSYWADLVETPQKLQLVETWLNKTKEALIFGWSSTGQTKDFAGFKKAALAVILRARTD